MASSFCSLVMLLKIKVKSRNLSSLFLYSIRNYQTTASSL
nr:MAG TPA: hypothetical protein [Caudoviricetes sp.]